MNPTIKVGVPAQPDLPPDKLTAEERSELHRLLSTRQALADQVRNVEHRIQLLVLVARDKRGIIGEVGVDPDTGRLWKEGSNG